MNQWAVHVSQCRRDEVSSRQELIIHRCNKDLHPTPQVLCLTVHVMSRLSKNVEKTHRVTLRVKKYSVPCFTIGVFTIEELKRNSWVVTNCKWRFHYRSLHLQNHHPLPRWWERDWDTRPNSAARNGSTGPIKEVRQNLSESQMTCEDEVWPSDVYEFIPYYS